MKSSSEDLVVFSYLYIFILSDLFLVPTIYIHIYIYSKMNRCTNDFRFVIIIIIIIVCPSEFFKPALANGLSLKFNSKFLQVSRTLLSILADLHNEVVWMVSTCPLIS